MNKDTQVIIDYGNCYFDSFTASFFCKQEITENNIINEVSTRLGYECISNGYNSETDTVYIIASKP